MSPIQQCIRESRLISLRNMWMVIFSLLFGVVFDTTYTLTVFFAADQDCNFPNVKQWLPDTYQLFDRFFMYFFWVYPLLYVFWPSVKTLKEQKDYHSSLLALLSPSEDDLSNNSSFISGQALPKKQISSFLRSNTPLMVEEYYEEPTGNNNKHISFTAATDPMVEQASSSKSRSVLEQSSKFG